LWLGVVFIFGFLAVVGEATTHTTQVPGCRVRRAGTELPFPSLFDGLCFEGSLPACWDFMTTGERVSNMGGL